MRPPASADLPARPRAAAAVHELLPHIQVRKVVDQLPAIRYAREECGMIEPIGEFVMQSSCAQVARWQAEYPRHHALGVSVNLSARQFRHPELHALVAGALARSGLAPASLSLEITESVL